MGKVTLTLKTENNLKEYEKKLIDLQIAQNKAIKWTKKASSLADELAGFEISTCINQSKPMTYEEYKDIKGH